MKRVGVNERPGSAEVRQNLSRIPGGRSRCRDAGLPCRSEGSRRRQRGVERLFEAPHWHRPKDCKLAQAGACGTTWMRNGPSTMISSLLLSVQQVTQVPPRRQPSRSQRFPGRVAVQDRHLRSMARASCQVDTDARLADAALPFVTARSRRRLGVFLRSRHHDSRERRCLTQNAGREHGRRWLR